MPFLCPCMCIHTHIYTHTHTHKFMHTHTHTQHTHIFVLCVCASICMFCVHILASVLPKVNVLFGLVKMFSGVMEQVARHTPNCRRHYVILAVAEILFVFNFLVTHWLHPHHQISFPIVPPASPLLIVRSPWIFFIIFAKRIEHVAVYMELNCTTPVDMYIDLDFSMIILFDRKNSLSVNFILQKVFHYCFWHFPPVCMEMTEHVTC